MSTKPGSEIVLASDQIVPIAPVVSRRELLEASRKYAHGADARNTRIAYESDMKHFQRWCAGHGVSAMPASPEDVALYITALASGQADSEGPRKSSTIRRRLASIAVTHGRLGFEDPTKDARVKTIWRGIRNNLGVQSVGKAALLRDQARICAKSEPNTLTGFRNKAIFLYLSESAERRSEMISMRIEDLEFSSRGVIHTIPRSKTNQDGKLEWLGIERQEDTSVCPVAALELWIERAGIKNGWVFPSDRKHGKHLNDSVVARIIKAAVHRTGIGDARLFAGHSTRRGYVTAKTRLGMGDAEIRTMTRHKSSKMLDVYREQIKREDWSMGSSGKPSAGK